MTISLPGSKKRGLAGLLSQQKTKSVKPAAKQQLDPSQVAKLFKNGGQKVEEVRPAKLNAFEKQERDNMSTLRGALYAPKKR